MKLPRYPFTAEPEEDFETMHFILSVAVVFFFLLLVLRLWYLQIVRGQEFRTMSESNRTRFEDIQPTRGLILDRNGVILVDNCPAYQIAVIREDVAEPEALLTRLAYILGRPLEKVQAAWDAIRNQPAFKPALLFKDLTREELVAIETFRFRLPGIIVQVVPKRRYRHPLLAAHVIGYLGEVTQDQLDQPDYLDHRLGDRAGQYGVEKEMEPYLHGRRGQKVLEVNAGGRILQVIDHVDPIPGHNVYLTLDFSLQEAAMAALEGQAGAVVALDPNNGEILALASTPTFDQSDFADGISGENWRKLLKNPLHPLENRAVSGQYPPGSTYKFIPAIAALEEGVVAPGTRIFCPGSYTLGDRVFNCWKRYGHGSVNLHAAIRESCDVYFYDVGLRLGVDRLARYAREFGLGHPTGVGLSNEKPGLVPTSDWKKKRYDTSWQKGETLSVAIGQGFNLATPIQMAQATAILANGGLVYQPHIVKKVEDVDGKLVLSSPPQIKKRLSFKPENMDLVRKGLTAVVNEKGGTGHRAKVKGIRVAGKTGTAQVVALTKNIQSKDLPYRYRDHAWFVAFAPAENPEIAVAVLLEHAGGGGAEAAPVAQKVLEAFFYPEIPLTPGLVISEEPPKSGGRP